MIKILFAIVIVFIIGQYINYYIPEHRADLSEDKFQFLSIVQTAMHWSYWVMIVMFGFAIFTTIDKVRKLKSVNGEWVTK